jgi:hypothetical protein
VVRNLLQEFLALAPSSPHKCVCVVKEGASTKEPTSRVLSAHSLVTSQVCVVKEGASVKTHVRGDVTLLKNAIKFFVYFVIFNCFMSEENNRIFAWQNLGQWTKTVLLSFCLLSMWSASK